MAEVPCGKCGKPIQRKPVHLTMYKKVYCSRKCHYADKKIRPAGGKEAYQREWRKGNRSRHNELNTLSNRRIKKAVFALLGDQCIRCGFKDARALQVDHVYRATEKHGESGRSGSKLYAAILRGERTISDFQLLCANCNWIKRFENNEHNGKNKHRQLGKEPDGEEVING